jgi:hypothetical protein
LVLLIDDEGNAEDAGSALEFAEELSDAEDRTPVVGFSDDVFLDRLGGGPIAPEVAVFLALDPKEEGRQEARVKPLTRHSGG